MKQVSKVNGSGNEWSHTDSRCQQCQEWNVPAAGHTQTAQRVTDGPVMDNQGKRRSRDKYHGQRFASMVRCVVKTQMEMEQELHGRKQRSLNPTESQGPIITRKISWHIKEDDGPCQLLLLSHFANCRKVSTLVRSEQKIKCGVSSVRTQWRELARRDIATSPGSTHVADGGGSERYMTKCCTFHYSVSSMQKSLLVSEEN